MSYYRYRYSDFKITKREVLFSVVIVAVMLMIGFVIHGNINESLMLEYQKYNTALKIEDDKDMFTYGMCTDVGNAFVYGKLKAVDTVTYPEIGGEYMYVEKVKEKYTKHTRTVKYTDSNGKTKTRIETYWTWDRVGSEYIKCKEISFCDVVFNSNKIDLPTTNYIDTIKESSHIRYKYYGVLTEYTGTIFTELKDETISDNTKFYNNYNIQKTINSLESGYQLVAFWIFWIPLIGGLVYGFYYLDNKWLEDKRNY